MYDWCSATGSGYGLHVRERTEGCRRLGQLLWLWDVPRDPMLHTAVMLRCLQDMACSVVEGSTQLCPEAEEIRRRHQSSKQAEHSSSTGDMQ